MAILEKYQRDHYSTLWIQTLQVGIFQFSGLFAGAIIEKKGYMFTAILAGVIYTLSFLISSFLPVIEVLYLTIGVGTGISTGLLAVVAVGIIPLYFDKKLGMAIGLTQAGVGIGLLVFSALNGYLIGTYGLQGSFLILAGIAAHTIPLGMLLHMPHMHTQKAKNEITCKDILVATERHSLLADDTEQLKGKGYTFRNKSSIIYLCTCCPPISY